MILELLTSTIEIMKMKIAVLTALMTGFGLISAASAATPFNMENVVFTAPTLVTTDTGAAFAIEGINIDRVTGIVPGIMKGVEVADVGKEITCIAPTALSNSLSANATIVYGFNDTGTLSDPNVAIAFVQPNVNNAREANVADIQFADATENQERTSDSFASSTAIGNIVGNGFNANTGSIGAIALFGDGIMPW